MYQRKNESLICLFFERMISSTRKSGLGTMGTADQNDPNKRISRFMQSASW